MYDVQACLWRWCRASVIQVPHVVRVPSPWASTATAASQGATETPATAGASGRRPINSARCLSGTPSVQGEPAAQLHSSSRTAAACDVLVLRVGTLGPSPSIQQWSF